MHSLIFQLSVFCTVEVSQEINLDAERKLGTRAKIYFNPPLSVHISYKIDGHIIHNKKDQEIVTDNILKFEHVNLFFKPMCHLAVDYFI